MLGKKKLIVYLSKVKRNPFVILWVLLCIGQGIAMFVDPPSFQYTSEKLRIDVIYMMYRLLSWFIWTMKLALPALILSLFPTYFFSGIFLSIIGSGQFSVALIPLVVEIMTLHFQVISDWGILLVNSVYLIGILIIQLIWFSFIKKLSESYKYRLQYDHKKSFIINWWNAFKEVGSSEFKVLLVVYFSVLILKVLTILL
ncbi:hypothetical protein [Lentilactobacillus farraginis]|uniref:Uncharacterized protein n=1 Tax=Lentilactobacillus farraginis DSM 18382 = JCM 14108 TaxID=1423743 RepID=X0PCF1_9LACO|nr:hypothetical protein [Lentilactobacillus farraginis]KRM03274.1 hypothetical protein FD41_GL001163 [Lentilactobacillus farraginis DSM 18382 = JCM 14108]GAF38028.1 hypothetical protein JCM14108_3126 [Lentilactobacillus farraginis DSM 18382 = JCM 14108]